MSSRNRHIGLNRGKAATCLPGTWYPLRVLSSVALGTISTTSRASKFKWLHFNLNTSFSTIKPSNMDHWIKRNIREKENTETQKTILEPRFLALGAVLASQRCSPLPSLPFLPFRPPLMCWCWACWRMLWLSHGNMGGSTWEEKREEPRPKDQLVLQTSKNTGKN